MKAKTVLLTGATSGIGYEVAKQLYLDGYHLILANRNQEKAKNVKNEFLSFKSEGTIDLEKVDLSSFSSIKKFFEAVKSNYSQIDVLINNAGVFSRDEAYTEDGFELALGVNYLGTYYLTELFLPLLKKSKGSKIIMVSSIGSYYGRLELKKDFFSSSKSNFRNYFNSKLANLIYSNNLQKKNPDLIIKAADPGVAYSNIWKWKSRFGRMINKLYKLLFKSSKKAARIIIKLVESNQYDNESKLLYKYDKALRLPRKTKDLKFNKRFLEMTSQIIKDKV